MNVSKISTDLQKASIVGDLNTVKNILSTVKEKWRIGHLDMDVLHLACKYGHSEIVDYMLDQFQRAPARIAQIFGFVCAYRQTHIIEHMIVRYIKALEPKDKLHCWNRGLADACGANNEDIVDQMLQLGANDFNEALNTACECGHEELAKRMIDLGANDRTYLIESKANELIAYMNRNL